MIGIVVAAAWIGCSPQEPIADSTADAARLYPDLFALYASEHGVYRGCGPSNGVCHNANEYPNLSSYGSILENVDRGCNLKRDDPTMIHDLCEREGDRLQSGDRSSEIAWIELADAEARRWRVHLREPIAMAGNVEVTRNGETLYWISDYAVTAEPDPADTSGRAVLFTVPAPVMSEEDDDVFDFGALIARSGVLGDPWAIQVGDPNRNGIFGAELGGRIIAPGDPARSYLIARLTDPDAGPLMPRANCCHWTKAALRALYCWVDGLAPDGSNAMGPIDYARCSAGPPVELLYPEPGPGCETAGLCPVEAVIAGDEPTFHNVYARVLVPSCSGAECHASGAASRLDFSSEARAFDALATKVVAGDAEASALYRRISPELCMAPDCATMPLGLPPLPVDRRDLVRAWIEAGAGP